MEVLINGKHHTHTDNPVTAYDVCGNPHTIKPIDYHLYNFTSFKKLIIDGAEISPESEEGMERCKTCANGYSSVACTNCGTGFRNYVSIDCEHEVNGKEIVKEAFSELDLQQCYELAVYKRLGITSQRAHEMVEQIQAQQQEIDRLTNLSELGAAIVEHQSQILEALTADKDEQAEQMKYLLRRTLPILEATNNQQELIEAIDALLGGAES